jgi:plasmid stability protein
MADAKIRKLDDWVVQSFRARAKEAGRSLEEELRQFLTERGASGAGASSLSWTPDCAKVPGELPDRHR